MRAWETRSTSATCAEMRSSSSVERLAAQQRGRHRCEQRCLALTLLGEHRSAADPHRELAGDDGDDDVDASASQFSLSESVNVCVGGRKNQLNASTLATAAGIASAMPQTIAIGRTAKT